MPSAQPLWPLILFFGIVIVIVAAMLIISYVLGQHHSEHATGAPYEGGIVGTGSADVRFSMKFYLVAMLFVVFDLESVFIYTWAVAGRELGWAGYAEVCVFVGLLVAAFIYLWRLGALDWGGRSARRDLR